MLITFEKAVELINGGKLLHIAGSEDLLKKLPKGNWIGGSTIYFMTESGGKVSDDLLFVSEMPYENFEIKTYEIDNLKNIASDAFDSGFSIVILPYESEIHMVYAQNAMNFKDMYIKHVVGWVSGTNLRLPTQIPIAINGLECVAHPNKAVVLHIEVPAEKTVSVSIINIFHQDKDSPVIEFFESGFTAKKALINGKETAFAEYCKQNDINEKFPIVGDYSGNGVNVTFKEINGDTVVFSAPVFTGIKYKAAIKVSDYAKEFETHVANHKNTKVAFSCNCISNFIFGELEGKTINPFTGPITSGEIAYQLLNQTLVYVAVE